MLLWLLWLSLLASFGMIVLIGPPYLPTFNKQVETALDMLELKPGQRLLELGCGDGRVLVAAARRGYKATGIELNPFLACISWLRTRRYGDLVTVRVGNYWNTNLWGEADAIFGFVLPKYMTKLDRLIQAWRKDRAGAQTEPFKLASFAFQIPNKKIVRQRHGVFLYEYRQA